MLKLSMIFSSKMVLQREKPIRIWGNANPHAIIIAKLGNAKVSALTDIHGNWMAAFPARKAETGLTMTVTDGEISIELSDICVGEVWVAGGQSNMEFLLGFEEHFDEVVKQETCTEIRFFDYPEVAYEGEYYDRNFQNQGYWRGCSAEDLAYYSAVGYYFSRNLQDKLHVPVGIIGCNWAGTPACAWMEPDRLVGTAGEVWIKEYEESVKNLDMDRFLNAYKKNPMNDRSHILEDPFNEKLMKVGLSREEQIEAQKEFAKLMESFEPAPIMYERRPGGLYETMLKKIVPYGIRGVIWYQGETDGDYHPEAYTEVFSSLIQNWRELWREELPFLFTQLAPFEAWMMCVGKDYGIVRSCQDAVSKMVPNTWMATTGDVGMQWDIHPKNKRPVGERLALLARGHVYGEEGLVCDAPECILAEQCGEDVVLTFQYGEGLYIEAEILKAVQVMCEMGEETVRDAEVKGNQLILHHVPNAQEVRLGQTDYYEVNLYNESHIPAKPFVCKVSVRGNYEYQLEMG